MDLIERQAAIDALDVLCQEHRYKIPGKRETYNQYNEAWQDALDRAEGAIFNLPSAQPEGKKGVFIPDITVEMLRKALLEAVEDLLTSGEMKDIVLPSAQPYTEEQLQKLQDLEQAQLEEAYRLGRESAHQWISCDERLPDPEAKIYWVCTDTGYQCQCRWTNINHFWTDLTVDWHWHIMDVSQYSKVVAWMSLPEPYKENKDERD